MNNFSKPNLEDQDKAEAIQQAKTIAESAKELIATILEQGGAVNLDEDGLAGMGKLLLACENLRNMATRFEAKEGEHAASAITSTICRHITTAIGGLLIIEQTLPCSVIIDNCTKTVVGILEGRIEKVARAGEASQQ